MRRQTELNSSAANQQPVAAQAVPVVALVQPVRSSTVPRRIGFAVLGTAATATLCLIALASGTLAVGALTQPGPHRFAFIVATGVFVSCLWAIGRVWKRPATPPEGPSRTASFEVWLAQKIVAGTDLTDQQVAELQDQYRQEFGTG